MHEQRLNRKEQHRIDKGAHVAHAGSLLGWPFIYRVSGSLLASIADQLPS